MVVATSTDQCPWCESSITRAKFVEVQGRIRAEEKRQLATLEADLRSKFDAQLKDVNEKLQNLAAEKAAFELRLKQAVELATLTARKAADEEEKMCKNTIASLLGTASRGLMPNGEGMYKFEKRTAYTVKAHEVAETRVLKFTRRTDV